MKTKAFLSSYFATGLALCAGLIRVPAQNDAVTISASEFQRTVYSAHLLTQLAEKPELDASLQVLLELHRRNPNADALLLAGVLQEATARYRSNAPAHLRTHGSRDEILAAYLDALRQVAARTNLVPANLSLLHALLTRARPPTLAPQADLIHSGSQSLLGAEGDWVQRQALLDACVSRAWRNGRFWAAMDSVLLAETLVSLGDSSVDILTNTNSPLHDNPTMQMLLASSTSSGQGSVTVSSNQLMALFSGETQTFWDTIHTNVAVQAEINRSQPDLLAYLTNQPAIDANAERLATVRAGQSRRIASSTAAVLVQSKLMKAKEPLIKLPGQMQGIVEGLHKVADGLSAVGDIDISKFGKIAACGNILSGGLQLFNLFTGGESAEDEIAREVGNLKTLLGDLSTNINYRFDRVDQSLTTIFNTLNERFDQVEITLDAHGRQIAHLNGDVDQIRLSLLDVQTDLVRLERNLATFHALDWRFDLLEDMNLALGYEARVGTPMAYDLFLPSYVGMENAFYTHAFNRAASETLSRYTTLPFGDEYLYSQLSPAGATNVYAEVLNYLKKCLRQRLGLAGFPEQPVLANPQDWAAAASAWVQLALENPGHFRRYERDVGWPSRLDGIISKGRDLTNFIGQLALTSGTNINWPLYAALQGHYVGKLTNFSARVRSIEQSASGSAFALDTWRAWSASAPRVNALVTDVLVNFPLTLPPIPRDAADIAAGGAHSLALRRNGTVIAWGSSAEGQSTVPTSATNVASIAAGGGHSLAAQSNGVVIAWGSNAYGQTNTPPEATNVIAVAAGHHHSLALRADGSVVGWGAGRPGTSGFPHFGQATVPGDATNVIAIAAGGYHSLALRADGTLVGWGLNNEGQLAFPGNATNLIAIAAGHGHNLALQRDGTLVAWGNNLYGSTTVPPEATNIVAIAAAGWHCLAQRADGRVFSWGRNDARQTTVPFRLGSVQKLAAGLLHSLALKEDGTVAAWGANEQRQAVVPPTLSWANVLSANWTHFLALRADGTAVEYATEPDYGNGLKTTPANATNGVAAAAGGGHNLLLQASGKVVGWGDTFYGQSYIPPSATNVIVVAAGDGHSLAVRGDSTVVGWGRNEAGQATGTPNAVWPSASTGVVVVAGQVLSNVVAVAGGSGHSVALKADGTVIGWGYNAEGQATGVPNIVAPYFSSGVVSNGGQPLTNVTMIAAGESHTLALRRDGTVVGWGYNQYGQASVPAGLTNVVAISAAEYHNLALRADGTVIGWGGRGTYGETRTPAGATNVVAIAAGGESSAALRRDGSLVAWGESFQGHLPIPTRGTNVISVAAGQRHNLALRSDGGVVAWGDNSDGQATPPAGATNVVAVAAGSAHSLALKADRTVLAWGNNDYGQRNPPASAQGAVAIAAGRSHNLALKADGTIVGWGYNLGGAATGVRGGGPGFVIFEGRTLTNVVAMAGGSSHSLALRADGTVIGWGWNGDGEATGVPTTSSPYFGAGVVTRAGNNVVAIAAGESHSLALRADGTIVGWGLNSHGQTNRLPELTNVVAIAAGYDHNLALRGDGTVVAWGFGGNGQTTLPPGSPPVMAIAASQKQSLFLVATETGGPIGAGDPFIARANVPARVGQWLYGVNGLVLTNLNLDLRADAVQLSGSKALLQAVLELAMPDTLERDDVLRGFLYGSESLLDLETSGAFLAAENAHLNTRPDCRPQTLGEVGAARFLRFSERLTARLQDLAASGQPEIPRLVSQTLRQLAVLRDAWSSVAPPALETGREGDGLRVGLYGEPFVRYTLQYRDNLSVPGWITTTITNLHNEEFITLPMPAPQRYYRALLP